MKQIDLSLYCNKWYKPGNYIVIIIWYFVNMFFINTKIHYPSFLKAALLRLFGAKLGSNIIIKPKVNIKYPWLLEIGNNCWIGEDVWIDNLSKVIIGCNVCLSQGSMILCGNHNYKSTKFDLMIADTIIEDGVWIGAKSVVCPGVKCGSHSVLTVGSIITKNMIPYYIYQGNPAKKMKERILKK